MKLTLEDPKIATKDQKPGVKIQMGRSMGVVFPPSSYEPHPEEDSVPRASLQLEHVYGYNGSLPHSVSINKEGSVVYATAGVGVILKEDGQQRHFLGHNEDITCFAPHPEGAFIATGQTDPKGSETPYSCVWDSTTEPPQEVSRVKRGASGIQGSLSSLL